MTVKPLAALLFSALLLTAGSAMAQYGYTVQGPQPAGMAAPQQQPVGQSYNYAYASSSPTMDPNMGMGRQTYGGAAYVGQQNYPTPQTMVAPPPMNSMLTYGQLEVDYLRTVYKDKTVNPSNGAAISLMAKLFDPVFLHFGVDMGNGTSKAFSNSYNFSTLRLGGGAFWAISDRVHLTGELGMSYAHMDKTATSVGFSEGSVYMMPGIRFLASDSFELDGHLTASSADKYDSFVFDIGGYYKLFSQMDVGLDIGLGDQSTTYRAGVRFRW